MSSFLPPEIGEIKKLAKPTQIDRLEQVHMRRLHSMILPIDSRDSIFLKIDTQGFEEHVLGGAEGLLCNVAAVQVELSILPYYRGAPDWLKIIKLMDHKKFFISGIFPVSWTSDLRAIEVDCVFSRKIQNHV